MSDRAWVDLSPEDEHRLLISLIGHRFGEQPEQHLDAIRAERRAYAAKFIKMARVRPDDTMLDLGPGCGFGTAAIAECAGRVIACDISPAYLQFARRECRELDNVTFRQIPSRDLSILDDRSIDKIISMAVFIHLNLYDVYLYFREFARVLKPGGLAVIDFADMNRLFGRFSPPQQDRQFLDHASYYEQDPASLAGLVQWNSARGIKGVARKAGLAFRKRRGHKLAFGRSARG